MITSADIREKSFQKSGMGGYKQADVEAFVSEVADAFDSLSAKLAAAERSLREQEAKVEEYKKNEGLLQSALLNAQRLANQITTDAKNESEQLARQAEQAAEKVLERAKNEAEALINEAQTTSNEMLERARQTADGLTDTAQKEAQLALQNARDTAVEELARAREQVALQQEFFGALKAEVAAFKTDVLAMFDAQTLLIKQLPDEVPLPQETEPERNAVEVVIDEMVDDIAAAEATVEEVKNQVAAIAAEEPAEQESEQLSVFDEPADEQPAEVAEEAEQPADEPDGFLVEIDEEEPANIGGFTITIFDDEEEEEEPAPTDGGTLSFGGNRAEK